MKNLQILLNKLGWLPEYMQHQDSLGLLDLLLLSFIGLFIAGGIAISLGIVFFLTQEFFQEKTGLNYAEVFRYIKKRKIVDYYKKRRLKAGDIVAFKFDDTLVLLKVTDNWHHSKTVVAVPLKMPTSDQLKLHYIAILAELKKNFTYNEIQILNHKTLMRILYGK